MDLVVWGHEHECLIDPQKDHQMGFHIMQPGSTVATSLMPGEAVQKHVAILKIRGKEFESEAIPLKTVRPFVTREVVLQDEPGMKKIAKRDNNRTDITRHLEGIVREMINEAKSAWAATHETNEDESGTQQGMPLPLIRLRVEYTAPEGGRFDCENPQRFSRRFEEDVANVNDVILFHRKKTTTLKAKDTTNIPEEEILERLTIDSVKVDKLVREYLTAQALTILPQNSFGDAVSQFVNKDDKHAMEAFVEGSLGDQVKHLMTTDGVEDEDIQQALDKHRARLEELFAGGNIKQHINRKFKPKPANWDEGLGEWEEQPGALLLSDSNGNAIGEESDEDEESNMGPVAARPVSARGRGRGRGPKSAGTTRNTTSNKSASVATKGKVSQVSTKSRKPEENTPDFEDDIVMLDDDEDRALSRSQKRTRGLVAQSGGRNTSVRKPVARPTTTRQTTLGFSQSTAPQNSTTRRGPFEEMVCVPPRS